MLGLDWLTGDVLGAGVGVLAGLSGGSGTSGTTTIDPRIGQYVYGQDGNSGLLGDVNSIYRQQMAQGGLNPMQQQGLNIRAQYLNSPQYKQTFDQMQQVGTGLLASPIAGNPFTQGRQGAAPVASFHQFNAEQPGMQPVRPQAQPQIQPGAQQTAPGMQGLAGSGGNNRAPSGAVSDGQGIDADTTKAALAAMAASDNPAIRVLLPTLAALLGFFGKAVANQQIDGMSAAGNKLSDSQPLANLGIGTVSDESGNVRTYSSPSTLAAADRASFGVNSSGGSYGGIGNGGYGGLTGGYGGAYGSGSVGGFGRNNGDE